MFDKLSEKIATIIVNGIKHIVKDIGNNNVKITRRRVIVNDQVLIDNVLGEELNIKWEGGLVSLSAGGSVECGDVNGDVEAGNGVKCGNVHGSIDAGNGVVCGDVGGSIDAGNSVVCSNIKGDVDAGGGVTIRK